MRLSPLRCNGGGRIDRVDATGAGEAVQLAVGLAEVDADDGFATLQAGDRHVSVERPRRRKLEGDEAVVRRRAEYRRNRHGHQRCTSHSLTATDRVHLGRSARGEIDRVQLRRRRPRQIDRGERLVVEARDVERRDGLHVANSQCSNGQQIAVVRVAGRLPLNLQLIGGSVEQVQRGSAGSRERVRVRRRHDRRARRVQCRIRRRRARVDVDAQVLARVAYDAQTIRNRVEIHAEFRAIQR